jgi:hypothetical protein
MFKNKKQKIAKSLAVSRHAQLHLLRMKGGEDIILNGSKGLYSTIDQSSRTLSSMIIAGAAEGNQEDQMRCLLFFGTSALGLLVPNECQTVDQAFWWLAQSVGVDMEELNRVVAERKAEQAAQEAQAGASDEPVQVPGPAESVGEAAPQADDQPQVQEAGPGQ